MSADEADERSYIPLAYAFALRASGHRARQALARQGRGANAPQMMRQRCRMPYTRYL